MTVVKFEYNPNLDISNANASLLEWMDNRVIGAYRVNAQGAVEWNYISDNEEEYSSFIDNFITWLEEKGFKSGVFYTGIDYKDCLVSLEASYLKWWFKEHNDVPLVKFETFKVLVDNYANLLPKDYRTYKGEMDLSDTINETGLSSIDIHSIGNMLSHFHDEYWVTKAERMTIIAYKYDLDIHPMAIALTPNVIANLR